MDLQEKIRNEVASCLYFKGSQCSVCDALQPKVEELIKKEFPKIAFTVVDPEEHSALSARFRIFSAPTILVLFDNKETIRKGGNISLADFQNSIQRYYSLYFD